MGGSWPRTGVQPVFRGDRYATRVGLTSALALLTAFVSGMTYYIRGKWRGESLREKHVVNLFVGMKRVALTSAWARVSCLR